MNAFWRWICLLIFILSLPRVSFSQDNYNYTVDSIYVAIDGKIISNEILNLPYYDSIVVYQSNDTVVRLLSPTRIRLNIKGVSVIGNHTGGGRKTYLYAEFNSGTGTHIFVKTRKEDSCCKGFTANDIIGYVLPTIVVMALIISMLNFSYKSRPKKPVPEREDGQQVVDRLQQLEYFKYTPAALLDALKKELVESVNMHSILTTLEDEETLEPYDSKLYFCDEEALFEEEGFGDALQRLKNGFTTRNLVLEWEEEKYSVSGNTMISSIVVNEKLYSYRYKVNDDRNWEYAVTNFCTLINDQLQLQKSIERIYMVSSVYDGQLILLTDEQLHYLKGIKLETTFVLHY